MVQQYSRPHVGEMIRAELVLIIYARVCEDGRRGKVRVYDIVAGRKE